MAQAFSSSYVSVPLDARSRISAAAAAARRQQQPHARAIAPTPNKGTVVTPIVRWQRNWASIRSGVKACRWTQPVEAPSLDTANGARASRPTPLRAVILIHLLLLLMAFIGLDRFFRFLILYTVGRAPRTGDQPVARHLSIHAHASRGIRTHDRSV
jgi:hypothetical protein